MTGGKTMNAEEMTRFFRGRSHSVSEPKRRAENSPFFNREKGEKSENSE
jgi:hypothetical protein